MRNLRIQLRSIPRTLAQLTPILGALLLISPGLSRSLQEETSQDGGISREQAALAEEQALIRRQLRRLRETMSALAGRLESEGRVHAAGLLRDALKDLDQRSEESNGRTLEELIDSSRDDLSGGRTMSALERQRAVEARLMRLLEILLDRRSLDTLEEELARLKEIKEALRELSGQEAGLQEKTAALIQASKTREHLSLETALERINQEQRDLLHRSEELAHSSGTFDLEQLRTRLAEMLSDQELAVGALSTWSPADAQRLEALRPALEAARSAEEQAMSLQESADSLAASAQADDLEASSAALAEESARKGRQAQASGDELLQEAAKALAEIAEQMRSANTEAQKAAAKAAAQSQAQQLAEAATEARNAARKARSETLPAAEQIATEQTTTGAAAKRIAEALREAQTSTSPERSAAETDRAARGVDEGLHAQSRMGDAIKASQEEGQERSERLAKDLEHTAASPTQPQISKASASQAAQALQRGAKAQQQAAQAAGSQSQEAAKQAAQQAESELRQALEALDEAIAQAAEKDGRQDQRKALADEQASLEEDLAEAAKNTDSASLGKSAQEAVQRAIEQARSAMKQAASSLSKPGQGKAAAEQQREAIDALNKAQKSAGEGTQPSSPEGRQTAADLAAEQERLRQEMLNLARRNQERNEAASNEALDSAAENAQEASQSLSQASGSQSQGSPSGGQEEQNQPEESGGLEQAEEQEARTQQDLQQAMRELEEEEEQYQRLRQEELLFQIKSEVEAMRASHLEQIKATLSADEARAGSRNVSRRTRITLRSIAREEDAVGARAKKVADALEEEGVLVFHEIMRNIESDLTRIVRDMGEGGGYQSGAHLQALQNDVLKSLDWLAGALKDEMERREQEQQEQQEQEPNDDEPPLVPDAAELRLLKKLEEDVLERLAQLQVLHPELKDPDAELNPLLLEELTRLAYQHRRVGELFEYFRRRLGVPDPD